MLTAQILIALEILYYCFVTIFCCAFKPFIDVGSPNTLRGRN